jgi:hypothetical protein
VQHLTHLSLEQEVSKMSYAFMARNAMIGKDLIADLCDRFLLEEVAGILLISLERLVWFDAEAFKWAIERLIPADVMREIRRIVSITVSIRLIDKGLVPGKDFSANSMGSLLLGGRVESNIFGS